ncbi:hypothetical protein B0H12DRAFT_1033226, partial [Mycena haematopus]
WYHVQRSMIGSELVLVCTCPASNPDVPCVHEYLLREHGLDLFPLDCSLPDLDENVILFSRQLEMNEVDYLNHFSCLSPNKRGLSGRVIVTYVGIDDGTGHWNCVKDSGPCSHVGMCRQKFLNMSMNVKVKQITYTVTVPKVRKAKIAASVSYKQRAPPPWAVLPGDPTFEQVLPFTQAPQLLSLDLDSCCPCSEVNRQRFRPRDLGTIKSNVCTIYGLSQAFTSTIELQTCVRKRRFIGPDCISFGIFNYNNKALFTHEILDEYTAAFTTSETPFSAWVLVVSRRYSVRNELFCSAETFRAAWFSYVQLQYFGGDMTCPKCGPSAENTIWDGVTLAFNRKHLLPSLEPPTISQPSSIIRDSTRYLADQQILTDATLRRLIRKVVDGPPLLMGEGLDTEGLDTASSGEDEGDEQEDIEVSKPSKRNQELLERLDSIPRAVDRLAGTNKPLSVLFNRHFGTMTVVQRITPPGAYKRFFIQISADESVLQMANATTLKALDHFLNAPTQLNASALIDIPVLHDLLGYEFPLGNPLSSEVLDVCQWIAERGRAVLGWLQKDIRPMPLIEDPSLEKPWTETGCCYSMPKLRERPVYPKLKHDTRPDPGGNLKRGAKCSKFYSQYGEKRLTGGIMCAWCTHSICYGFHCIPRGEGRNDVFSALVTRWERPPKRVIYDFACALGPYCMTREPEFFAGTQFLIDDFHAAGHTKCAPAAFLKTYCAIDARLRHINSSAGECGNSGIARIRKSVSYMSQDRAIVYTKVFLSIWNRQRILAM